MSDSAESWAAQAAGSSAGEHAAAPPGRHGALIVCCAVVAVSCLAAALWSVATQQNALLRQQALEHAENYSRALAEFRTLYTSEVVARLRARGDVAITHDYAKQRGAVPLPATLALLIGEQLTARGGGRSRLYSPYPFPWRREAGGLRDAFDRDAWEALQRHPEQPYYKFEVVDGHHSLRYAVADPMRRSCVGCHNDHPDSPKKDWKEGDVRGVLEVVVPLHAMTEARTQFGTRLTLLIIGTVLGMVALAGVLLRYAHAVRRLAEARRQTAIALSDEVTERRRVEEQLRAVEVDLRGTMTALAASNRELDDFAHVVSHDLKEPLRGIQSYAQFVSEDYQPLLDQDGKAKLATIERLAQRMQGLIDDLHQFSRLGRVEMSWAETDLEVVVAKVIDSVRIRLDEQHVEVRQPRPLPTIRCDRVRVAEVFRNLITNALKYGDKPSRWIEIGCHQESWEGAPLTFYVRDNGIGIPPQYAERVFKMFKRLHARDAHGGGSGAGLAIVKRIVELHGGKVWVESEVDVGSTFYFTLASSDPLSQRMPQPT